MASFYQARGNYVSQTYDGYTYAFYSVGDYNVIESPDYVLVEYKEYLSIGCNTPYTSVARGTFYYTHNGVQYSIPDEWYVSSASEVKDVTHSTITIQKGTSAKTALFGAGFVSDGTGDFPAGTSSGAINIPIPAITKYTVTFDANGHGTAPASQSVFYGYKATQPTSPTASGWTFGGWYKEASCTNAWNFNSDTVKGNTKLYAEWTENQYTITYNANSATSGSAPASQTISYNNDSTLRAVPSGLVKTGHHLNSRTEWNRASNGTGTSYAAGTVSYKWTTFGSLTASSTAVTLYANWVKDTYTVTYAYDGKGGSGKPSNQTKTYGTALTLSSTKPTLTGYTFANWSASTGGTWNAGAAFTGNGSSNNDTITMTANWTANVYTITYDPNGGSGYIQALLKPYDESKPLSDGTGFTKTGTVNGAFVEYKQTGWNTKADGTGTSYSLSQQIADNTITSSFTLYAIWEAEVIYPTITNFEVYRTATAGASDLTPVDDGEYLVVHFNYTDCSEDGGTTAITPTCEITIDNTTYTQVLSNGECYYKNSTEYSQDATHAVSVRLYDPNQDYTRSSATASIVVPTAILPIDLYGSGTSVYMGLMHVHVEGQPITMPVTYVDNLYVDVDTTTQEEPDSSLWTAIHTDLSWF